MILDAGPASVAEIDAAIDEAATLVWNGPLGAFELTPFDAATVAAARHAAERTKAGQLVSVAGGGDTVAALNHAGRGRPSPTSRRRAAPSSNGWRARHCRASRRCGPRAETSPDRARVPSPVRERDRVRGPERA